MPRTCSVRFIWLQSPTTSIVTGVSSVSWLSTICIAPGAFAMLTGLTTHPGYRMKVGQTLFAQVREVVAWTPFGANRRAMSGPGGWNIWRIHS